MANESLNSTAGDIRAAQVLNRDVHLLLSDAVDISTLATMYEFSPGGSLVQKVGQLQSTYDFAVTAENAAAANTALVDGSISLTPARHTLRFENSDLFTLGAGDVESVGQNVFAQAIVNSVGRHRTKLLTALFSSLTNTVGAGAGDDFSVDTAFSAIFAMNNNLNAGRQAFVLKPHQLNELISSLRGETGAVGRLDDQNAAVLAAKGVGMQAMWMGREIWTSDHVVEGSGVCNGALIGEGALAMLEAPVTRMRRVLKDMTFEDAVLLITETPDDEKGTLRTIGNYYPAVAIQEQARAVLIETDDI